MHRLFVLFCLLCTALFGAAPPPPRIAFRAEPLAIRPGGEATLRVHLDLDPGWHTFPGDPQVNAEGLGPAPTVVTWAGTGEVSLAGPFRITPLHRRADAGFQMELREAPQGAVLEVPVRAAPGLAQGLRQERLRITCQVCRDERCLPPQAFEVPVSMEVQVAAPRGSGALEKATASPAVPSTSGLGAYLWLAMVAGAAALLTPCVFPMVPITVSFFTQRAESGRGGASDALLYGAGIMATFTLMGLILAGVFGATGIQAFATSGAVNLVLCGVFVLFALNLFGVLEVRLPQGLLGALSMQSGRGGALGVLLMGLTFSLTSFTCTVPFVGSALVAASRGAWFQPVLGMLAFSAVFALPFVLLAFFPSALSRLPKAGGWMVRLKVVMGFLELAAALKFLSNADLACGWGLLPRELCLALWSACVLMIVLYLLGFLRMGGKGPSEPLGWSRVLAAVVFEALLFFLLRGLAGRPLGELEAFLPPKVAVAGTASRPSPVEAPGWEQDYQQALALAKRTGRPLFIDFTGYTCTNCRWMEQNMFPRPAVAKMLDTFIRVRLYTDRNREPELAHKKLQLERFGSIELPLYAILAPDGALIRNGSFTRDEAAFLAFLGAPTR